jgi:hypothetical protein
MYVSWKALDATTGSDKQRMNCWGQAGEYLWISGADHGKTRAQKTKAAGRKPGGF